jgi:hypothetical protein
MQHFVSAVNSSAQRSPATRGLPALPDLPAGFQVQQIQDSGVAIRGSRIAPVDDGHLERGIRPVPPGDHVLCLAHRLMQPPQWFGLGQ